MRPTLTPQGYAEKPIAGFDPDQNADPRDRVSESQRIVERGESFIIDVSDINY